MNSLFINPLSENITLTVIRGGIIEKNIVLPKGDDFQHFPVEVVEVVDRHSVEEIWCICGPGAFTRMRIVTLALNTLAITRKVILKGCHFFDMFDNFATPVLRANDKEYILKGDDSTPIFVLKEDIPHGKYIGYGNPSDFTNGRDFVEWLEDTGLIEHFFFNIPATKSLSPIYLKEPHITGPQAKV